MIIIHLHIPKCGGTSLLDILHQNYQVTRLSNKDGWKTFFQSPHQNIGNCISAHMPYGIHAHIQQPSQYITFLRHPVDRLMSFYHYVKQRKGKSIWSRAMKGLSLEEFLEREDLHGNDMVRYVAGMPDIALPKTTKVTESDLEIAKTNIDKFMFVGDMERYPTEMKRMGDVLGIYVKDIPHKLNSNNPGRHGLSKALRKKILPMIQYDLELYHYARGQ